MEELNSLNGELADWSLNPNADSLKSENGESINFGENDRDYKAEGTSTKPELKQKNDQHLAFQTGNVDTRTDFNSSEWKTTSYPSIAHSVQRPDGTATALWSIPTYDTHSAIATVDSKVDLLNNAQIDAIFDMFSEKTAHTDCEFPLSFAHWHLMKDIPFQLLGFGKGRGNGGIRFLAWTITEHYSYGTITKDDYQTYKKQLVKNILQEGVEAKVASAERDQEGKKIANIIRLTFRDSQQSCRQARELVAWLTNDVFSVAVLEEIKPTAQKIGQLIILPPKPGSKGSVEYQEIETQNLIAACNADTSYWAKAIQAQKTTGIPQLSRECLQLKLAEEEQRLKEQQFFSAQPLKPPVANPSIHHAQRKLEPQHNSHYYPQDNSHYFPQHNPHYHPQNYSTGIGSYESYGNLGCQSIVPNQQPYNVSSGPQGGAAHVVANKPIPSDDLLNCKIPVDSPILWQLSQDIREWKFLARFLDLEEEAIEEIDQYTRPNKTRDKSLKMLTEWVNTSKEATWTALGEAIQDAENTLLYEKLQELLTQYAI